MKNNKLYIPILLMGAIAGELIYWAIGLFSVAVILIACIIYLWLSIRPKGACHERQEKK